MPVSIFQDIRMILGYGTVKNAVYNKRSANFISRGHCHIHCSAAIVVVVQQHRNTITQCITDALLAIGYRYVRYGNVTIVRLHQQSELHQQQYVGKFARDTWVAPFWTLLSLRPPRSSY